VNESKVFSLSLFNIRCGFYAEYHKTKALAADGLWAFKVRSEKKTFHLIPTWFFGFSSLYLLFTHTAMCFFFVAISEHSPNQILG
jgi:hypothetical protein